MQEKYLYARCREGSCNKIFEGQLSWRGAPGNADVYDLQGKSPLIDLLQQHHLETDMLAQHNGFALFTEKEQALIPPETVTDPTLIYRRFPLAIGYIGVSRQRNLAFSLRKDPTEDISSNKS